MSIIQFEIIIFFEGGCRTKRGPSPAAGLVGKYGSSLGLSCLCLVSSSSSLECLECSLLPFLSLQLLPSFSPAGLLQAKRSQKSERVECSKNSPFPALMRDGVGQMSRFGCSCSSRRLQGRQQLVSQLLLCCSRTLMAVACTDLQSVSLPLIEYLAGSGNRKFDGKFPRCLFNTLTCQ